jgi:alcohol-forming fatty acyl-CoA reductase
VFNIVASVKFNEPLKEAATVNIIGTKRVLDLVQQVQHLKAFVHISTLYSNCHLKEIGEMVYRPEISCAKFLNIIENFDSLTLEKYGQGLLQGMPNTYTLTKRYSEELVIERSQCLRAGIFRPPILMNTYQSPFAGWTDNLYGPASIAVGATRGFIHCIYGDAEKVANLVPVDYCVNALVAVAWDIGQKKPGNVPVYNYIYRENNLTWGQYMALIPRGFHEPLDKSVWYYSYTIVKRRLLFKVVSSLVHTFPGYLFDLFAETFGREQK